MQKGFNIVCIDANVLIHATFEDFDKPKHLKALKMLDSFADSGVIAYVTPQILREFFAISTNSTIFKKPLSNKQAINKIKDCLSRAVGGEGNYERGYGRQGRQKKAESGAK